MRAAPAKQKKTFRRRLKGAGVASPGNSSSKWLGRREVFIEQAAFHYVRQVRFGSDPVLDDAALSQFNVMFPCVQGQKVACHSHRLAGANLDMAMGLVSVPTALQAEATEEGLTIIAFYGAATFHLCEWARAAWRANRDFVGQSALDGAMQDRIRIGLGQ